MGKWVKGILWLLMTAILAPFLKQFCDMFTNPVDGIMVVGTCASWFPDYLVAFVGLIPWLAPLAVIIGVAVMLSKPEKPPEDRFPRI